MKMGEGTKQVKVDNWGVFFLQRLQMFFNKTDYCDLTLQFEGNVQLKVHRLVINACTEYFLFLEQSYGLQGDVLVMPSDLQPDVVLPIVNFMYTGLLEFHISIFEKLQKTAALMEITVLTKLLAAMKKPVVHSTSIKDEKKIKKFISQHNNYLNSSLNSSNVYKKQKSESDLPTTVLPGRKLPIWKRKTTPGVSFTELRKSHSDASTSYDSTPKPTRFEWPEEELSNLSLFESTFDDISYTSKPLLTKDYDPRPGTSKEQNQKRNRIGNVSESMSIDENSSDSHFNSDSNNKRRMDDKFSEMTKKLRFNDEKENNNQQLKLYPQINITHVGGKSSTDTASHNKIITEVLKRYPNIVKKNKNIKLKILAKNNNLNSGRKDRKQRGEFQQQQPDEGPWRCVECSTIDEPCEFVLYYLYRKHMTDIHHEKFDARMCRYCGHKCARTDLVIYHQYVKHGVKPPLNYDFPSCPKCPYIALDSSLMTKHKASHTKNDLQCAECKVTFSGRHNLIAHAQITGHSGKSGMSSHDCQYCTKKFHNTPTLFAHIKSQHYDDARKDGVVSLDEDDYDDLEREDVEVLLEHKKKINIISNVKVSTLNSDESMQDEEHVDRRRRQLEEGITNLGLVDIVVLDENEQYILQESEQQHEEEGDDEQRNNRKLKMEQEFIIPNEHHHAFCTPQATILNNSDIVSTDELVMVLTDQEYNDVTSQETVVQGDNSSNIVVLYSHPAVGSEGEQIITTSQGNIMINSETGVYELRNGDTFVPIASDSSSTTPPTTTTTTNGALINDQPTVAQIESIEMIQKEIESHIKEDEIIKILEEDVVTKNEREEEQEKEGRGEEEEEETIENALVTNTEVCFLPEQPQQQQQEEELQDQEEREKEIQEIKVEVQVKENHSDVEEEAKLKEKCVEQEQQQQEQEQQEQEQEQQEQEQEQSVPEMVNSSNVNDEEMKDELSTKNEENGAKEEADNTSAKNILEEWEDTDSQQSCKSEIKKPQNKNTVNKLMDDWEDDDEEAKN